MIFQGGGGGSWPPVPSSGSAPAMILKDKKNEIDPMVKGREAFYRHLTIPITIYSEVKYVLEKAVWYASGPAEEAWKGPPGICFKRTVRNAIFYGNCL